MTTTLTSADDPTWTVTPSLVLSYADTAETGVTVHRPIVALADGVAPLVTRTGRGLPVGTFQFLCATRELAEEVADLCNGSRFVDVASDTIPDAPYRMTPTGTVGRAQNSPFASWTVTVPYQRLT